MAESILPRDTLQLEALISEAPNTFGVKCVVANGAKMTTTVEGRQATDCKHLGFVSRSFDKGKSVVFSRRWRTCARRPASTRVFLDRALEMGHRVGHELPVRPGDVCPADGEERGYGLRSEDGVQEYKEVEVVRRGKRIRVSPRHPLST